MQQSTTSAARATPDGAQTFAAIAAQTGSILDVDNVTVRFGGIVALDGVSFDVARGEIVGFCRNKGVRLSKTVESAAAQKARE